MKSISLGICGFLLSDYLTVSPVVGPKYSPRNYRQTRTIASDHTEFEMRSTVYDCARLVGYFDFNCIEGFSQLNCINVIKNIHFFQIYRELPCRHTDVWKAEVIILITYYNYQKISFFIFF